MMEMAGGTSLILDGYSGLPVRSDDGPQPGTVEWLLEAVERHARAEADALEQYDRLGQASGDPVIALVMGLILEDEERHHALLRRIESGLRDAINWTHSPASLPDAASPRQRLAKELAEVALTLIAEEHSGARHLRDLAHSQKGFDSGLSGLLLEMMAMDSEKHARLLQFVHARLVGCPGKIDRNEGFR